MKNKPEPLKIAHFRFALIAPVIQGLYPDASEAAYYRRVTQDPILRPDGVSYKYSPDTLERWTGLYRKKGMDGLIPGFRKDKGVSRALSADAINEIYRLREKFPRINGVMIHQMLIQSSGSDDCFCLEQNRSKSSCSVKNEQSGKKLSSRPTLSNLS